MYDYIRGILTYLSGSGIVIEQGGIGYRIFCANPFSYQPLLKKETTVYLYQYVREDAVMLYGFRDREERELFVRLISVSGIGPRIAQVILASGTVGKTIEAIETGDNRYLIRFPGIGKKTAGQIILDLKGKMKGFEHTDSTSTEKSETKPTALEEAADALKMLGYSEKEIQSVFPSLKKQEMTAENYVKEALRLFLKRG